ncbi:MAG: hypothetical protein ACRC33_22605 [Gemmataceae bacterium]
MVRQVELTDEERDSDPLRHILAETEAAGHDVHIGLLRCLMVLHKTSCLAVVESACRWEEQHGPPDWPKVRAWAAGQRAAAVAAAQAIRAAGGLSRLAALPEGVTPAEFALHALCTVLAGLESGDPPAVSVRTTTRIAQDAIAVLTNCLKKEPT